MPEIEIKGVRVKFPFEPYPVQRKYMETVIEALENGQNAILESPTGKHERETSKWFQYHIKLNTFCHVFCLAFCI